MRIEGRVMVGRFLAPFYKVSGGELDCGCLGNKTGPQASSPNFTGKATELCFDSCSFAREEAPRWRLFGRAAVPAPAAHQSLGGFTNCRCLLPLQRHRFCGPGARPGTRVIPTHSVSGWESDSDMQIINYVALPGCWSTEVCILG